MGHDREDRALEAGRNITVRGWLATAKARLEGEAPGSGHEARLILEAVLGFRPPESTLRADRVLAAAEFDALARMLDARLGGMPLQYLSRSAPFRDLDLDVGPGVFVPRPETEGLVEIVLRFLADRPGAAVLDLCTGSGAVLAALLAENATLTGAGVELSPAALAFAETNLVRAGVAGRARLYRGDLYAPLPPGARFAAVVANPPYIPDPLWDTLPRDVRDFEPRSALLGGPDGTGVIRRIVSGAVDHLEGGGLLALEIDTSHAAAVRSLLEETAAFRCVAIREDLAGRPRYATARMEGRQK